MKSWASAVFLLPLTPSLCGSQASFSHVSMNRQIVTGRLGEDVILPCSFESGPNVVIHWKSQDTNVLLILQTATSWKTDPDLQLTDIPSSVVRFTMECLLSFRRLTLQDEGIYVCYVGTSLGKI